MDGFTDKNEAVLDVMEMVTGKRRTVGECVFDGKEWRDRHDLNFRDELSRREYEISGLCQSCQDAVFDGV